MTTPEQRLAELEERLRALAAELDEKAQIAANGLDFKYASALRYATAQILAAIVAATGAEA